jgi:hypothetical protein
MKTLVAGTIFLVMHVAFAVPPAHAFAATTDRSQPERAMHAPEGILQSIENANVSARGETLQVTRKDARMPVTMIFSASQGLGVSREHDRWWVLPIGSTETVASAPAPRIAANRGLWVLPVESRSKDHSFYLELGDGEAVATKTATGLSVDVNAESLTVYEEEARPHSDPLGHRFSIKIEDAPELEDALAGFYWGTMLPSVVEKTMAANFPYSSGYVLSTLNVSSYAGSYPAVDHEFQIKGRLAIGSDADLDVVRRMIELQFKLMDDDPEHLSRAPTSVQPDGRREYHVRRNSQDNRQNAAMFPLTANIEVVEEAWHYYEATKDTAWLRAHIQNLEHAAGWTLANTDQYGRVWSDVYYEDQVIKDGRTTQAQAFAAYTCDLLARMEKLLGHQDKAASYAAASKQIAGALIEPLPDGYWDEKNQRFIDWVDRDGKAHDHIHLLANALPVLFGYATAEQAAAVRRLIDAHAADFERFPSFLAVDIAAYARSEIGSGGPYDLSAAGRYWYWDAAYRAASGQRDVLLSQLKAVAAEGAKDNYFMGERYDMDYVYYVDGKDAHGAEKYYEYPNVFAAVLISKLLGFTIPADADISIAPRLDSFAAIELGSPAYALRYVYSPNGFALKNLSPKPRRVRVNLSGLGAGRWRSMRAAVPCSANASLCIVTLAPQQEMHWNPVN